MELFDEGIAARSKDNLEVLHSVEHRKGSNGRFVAPELVSVDHVWNGVIRQKLSEKGLCRLGVPPILQEKIQHCTGIINGLPQPEFPAPDFNADLVREPPGTPSGSPVSQFFGKERSALDVPLAERLVAALNAALLMQCLDVTLAQTESVIKPESVLDDAQRKAVAIRLTVRHGRPA